MTPIDKMKRATAAVRAANSEVKAVMNQISSADRMSLLSEDVVRTELRNAIKDLDGTLRALRKMA